MLFIKYALVVAKFTQHLLLLASFFVESSDASKTACSTQKGKKLATEEVKTFSFEAFAKHMKNIHDRAAQVRKMFYFLERLGEDETTLGTGWPVITQLIKSRGEFPNLNVQDNSIGGIIKKTIGAHSSAASKKTPEAEAKMHQNRRVQILQTFQSQERIREHDKMYVKAWAAENLRKAKIQAQTTFLNGRPDTDTVKLFKSLGPKDLETVKNFLRAFQPKDVTLLVLNPICLSFSKKHFQKFDYLTDVGSKKFESRRYTCQIENNEEITKDLMEIGSCEADKGSQVAYFRVAIAKIEVMNSHKGVEIEYFIAFDIPGKLSNDPSSSLYYSYVAKSFFTSLSEPYVKITPSGGKGKGKVDE